MLINLSYDASVNSAPAAFTAALNNAADFLDRLFVDPITINIDVGWGEINGQLLPSNALGESMTSSSPLYSYSQIKTALVNSASSAIEISSAASLPSFDPTHGATFDIGTANAEALGLLASNSVSADGWVGFSSAPNIFSFSPAQRSVPGEYDFIGTALHELTEVMGRDALLGSFQHSYSTLDLFRYSGPGTEDLSGGQPAYFSIDGGLTNLDNFNSNPNGDFGDWASSAGNDAMNAFVNPSALGAFTISDLDTLEAIGWDTSAPTIATDYQRILQRPASLPEQDAWLLQQASASMSDADVRSAFENSQETIHDVDPVIRLYQVAFGRVPDQAGLTVNVNALRALGSDVAIAQAFVDSQEFLAYFGSKTVNATLIEALYQNALGRSGATAEVQAWLNSGVDPAHLIIGFSDSNEFIARSQSGVISFLGAAAQGTESYIGPLISNSSHATTTVASLVGVSAPADLGHIG
jgi:hypothetical protein